RAATIATTLIGTSATCRTSWRGTTFLPMFLTTGSRHPMPVAITRKFLNTGGASVCTSFFSAIRQNVDRDESARNKTGRSSLPRNSEGWIVANCGDALGLSDPACFRGFGLVWFLGNQRVIAINSLRQLSKQYVG